MGIGFEKGGSLRALSLFHCPQDINLKVQKLHRREVQDD